MKAGFIGLGAMGEGMAANLAKAGVLAGVWSRTGSKAERLAAAHNVLAAADPADLARASDVIVTCVSADADVLSVVDAMLPALGPGKVVVDCSTISVATAKQAAEMVASTGAAFLDAPVSGGTEGARNGQLVMMVGGERHVLENVRPVLEPMTKSIAYMGDTGAGQATKAVNQIMVAGINQAVTEALAFAQAMGLDPDDVIDVIGGGAAGNWFLTHRGPTMVRDVFRPGFKVALHQKDLKICKDMAADFNVALPVVEMTLHHYERLMQEGHGDEDISSLFCLKREMFLKGNKKSL